MFQKHTKKIQTSRPGFQATSAADIIVAAAAAATQSHRFLGTRKMPFQPHPCLTLFLFNLRFWQAYASIGRENGWGGTREHFPSRMSHASSRKKLIFAIAGRACSLLKIVGDEMGEG